MIWGGNRLKTEFGYEIPSDHTGECWAISGHKNGDCHIQIGTYAGKTISEIWNNNREVFGNVQGEVFPLLIKIIDAKTDLSIQVHPNDEYAFVHENGSLGKTECWYILDCEKDATILIGHNAKDKEQLRYMINQKNWNELIHSRKIHKGDFFQIAPGTVHAIKAGTLLLETQQSSDITYRLYDYERFQNGKPRELHTQKSIDVIECPYIDEIAATKVLNKEEYSVEELISCEYYTVTKLTVFGEASFHLNKPFLLVSVIEGNGMIDQYNIAKGNHFIIPFQYDDYTFKGNIQVIVSSV